MLNLFYKGLLHVEHDCFTNTTAIWKWYSGWSSTDLTDIEAVRQSLCWVDGQDDDPQSLVCKLERQGRTACRLSNTARTATNDDPCAHLVISMEDMLFAN